MAINITPSNVVAFNLSLPAEKRFDILSDAGYAAAFEAYRATLPKHDTPSDGEKTLYRVLVLWPDGSWETVGEGHSAKGREAADPAKWSPAHKLMNRAAVMVEMSDHPSAEIVKVAVHSIRSAETARGESSETTEG